QEDALNRNKTTTPQNQLLPGCSWPYQQGPGPPPDVDTYPAPTPQACVMLTHTTLHTANCTSTFALLPCFLYCSTYCVCVVLIVFVCFMFTVCTYTPEQIPGRCKPTW